MERSSRQSLAGIAFVTAVTAWLLVLVFGAAGRGAHAAVEIVVYAATAGFGLEFLSSAWPSVWGRRG